MLDQGFREAEGMPQRSARYDQQAHFLEISTAEFPKGMAMKTNKLAADCSGNLCPCTV